MFAGVDTHKDTLAVAVIDLAGRVLACRELANTEAEPRPPGHKPLRRVHEAVLA